MSNKSEKNLGISLHFWTCRFTSKATTSKIKQNQFIAKTTPQWRGVTVSWIFCAILLFLVTGKCDGRCYVKRVGINLVSCPWAKHVALTGWNLIGPGGWQIIVLLRLNLTIIPGEAGLWKAFQELWTKFLFILTSQLNGKVSRTLKESWITFATFAGHRLNEANFSPYFNSWKA